MVHLLAKYLSIQFLRGVSGEGWSSPLLGRLAESPLFILDCISGPGRGLTRIGGAEKGGRCDSEKNPAGKGFVPLEK